MTDEQSPMGGLDSLRLSASGGNSPQSVSDMLSGPGQQSMDMLQNAQISDPSAKWEAFAAGALKPATGGFGEAMGNALGALSQGKQQEAELRAKYIPLIAQAFMQRQLQAAQLAMNQWKLTQDFDKAGIGALTGLLNKPEPLTGRDAAQALGSVVQRGLIPPDHAQRLYSTLPIDNPQELRNHITRLAIGSLEGKEAFGAVTPKVGVEDQGGARVPFNTNPTAPNPVGPMAGGMSKTLSPAETLGARGTEKDQAGNTIFTDKLNSTVRYGNNGAPLLGVQGGSPGPGGPPIKELANVDFEKGVGTKMSAYHEDLTQSLEAMRSMQQRLGDMREFIKNYQPGATSELRLQLGSHIKDLAVSLGLSPEQSDSIARSLSKGDVGSAQAFQKLATQGTLDVLKAANPRFTQAEFATISKNNPNLLNDPAAFDKMQNFITKQYQMKSAESQEFSKYVAAGKPLVQWPSTWNKQAQELGYIKPTVVKAAAKTSSGQSSSEAVGVALNGRPIKLTDKGWVYAD